MKEKIKGLLIKYKEFVLYALFGVLTTIANAGTFLIVSYIVGGEHHIFNNVVAWFAGVLVAFVTNVHVPSTVAGAVTEMVAVAVAVL